MAPERCGPSAPLAGAGDAWTWTAPDADSKLMVSYLVGNCDRECARDFIDDLGDRLENRVQLTTDGFSAYRNAVDMTFGNNVDFVNQALQRHAGRWTGQKV